MARQGPLVAVLLLLLSAAACGPKDETVAFAIVPLEPDPFAGLDTLELVIGTDAGDVIETYPVTAGPPEMKVTFAAADVRSLTLLGYENGCLRAEGQTTSIRDGSETPLVFTRLGRFQVFADVGVAARSGHSTTLLEDGRVLIVTDVLGEVFDPGSGTVTPVGDTLRGRSGHTALRLENGNVLIAGGASGGQIDVEIFDVGAMAFVDPGITLAAGRGEPAALLEVAPDQVVIAGGDATAAAERLDLATGTSTPLDSFVGRRGHSVVSSGGGDALIIGGDATGVTGLVERTRDGTQLAADPLAVPRSDATAFEMPARSAVVVLGGHAGDQVPVDAMEAVRGGSVVGLGDAPAGVAVNRGAATALGWDGSWALVAGGSAGAGTTTAVTLLEWPADDPAAFATRTVHPDDPDQAAITLQRARRGAQAVALPDGSVLISGGEGPSAAQVEKYEVYRPPVSCP